MQLLGARRPLADSLLGRDDFDKPRNTGAGASAPAKTGAATSARSPSSASGSRATRVAKITTSDIDRIIAEADNDSSSDSES